MYNLVTIVNNTIFLKVAGRSDLKFTHTHPLKLLLFDVFLIFGCAGSLLLHAVIPCCAWASHGSGFSCCGA